MRRWPAAAVAALLVGMIANPGVGASAASQRVVREAVVTTAGPDGTPQSTLVSQLVQLSSKDGSKVSLRMPKVSDLDSYRNLSGFSGPSGNAKAIVWHTTGSIDAQALAKINRKLPFEVHVKYFLNGKEIKPNDVNGKDGRLKIEVELLNASGDPKTLTYNGMTSPYLSGPVEEYIPFEYAVRITFPQHTWTGVTGDRFDVAPSGTDQIAAATGVLSPPLTDVSDTIDVSAHSSDMLRPKIEVYAFPKINPNLLGSLQTQYEALHALYSGTGQISDNLIALYKGTVQLVDGLSQFMGGTGQLNSGIGKIVAGVGTRNPKTGKPNITLDSTGTPTTLIGGIGAISDALTSAVLPGIGTRDPKTGKPVITLSGGTPTTVMGAIGSIDDAIRGAILPAVGTRDPVTGKGVIVLDDNGNTTTLLGGLQSQKNTYDNKLIPGVQQAACGINGKGTFCSNAQKATNLSSGLQQIGGGVGVVDNGIQQLLAKLQTNSVSNPGVREGLQLLAGGLSTLDTGLQSNDANNPGIKEGLTLTKNGLTALLAGLTNSDPNHPGLLEGLTGVLNGLETDNPDPAHFGAKEALDAIQSGLGTLIPKLDNPSDATALKQALTSLQTAASGQALVDLDPTGVAVLNTIATTLTAIIANFGSASTNPPDQTKILGALSGMKLLTDGLVTNLGAKGNNNPLTLIGAVQAMIAGLGVAGQNPPNLTTAIGGVEAMIGGANAMLAGLGDRRANPTDPPIFDPNNPTAIGGVETMEDGVKALLTGLGNVSDPATGTTIIGALELMHGALGQVLPGIDQELAGLGQLGVGIHNPDWDKPAKALGGLTPHAYFSQCPGCFDPTFKKFNPATANPKFQPGVLEVFHLFSDGIRDALPKLVSLDPKNPGLVDGLGQIADGLETLSKNLQTFDPKNPGLVDGLQLIVAGLNTLGSKLQTFDPKNPGLVDGLQLVQGGIGQLDGGAQQLHSGGQQISQGVFAIDQLGLRVVHGQVGDSGDTVAQDQAILNDALNKLGGSSTLAKADAASTTYVFEIAATSTATRDNLIRGGMIALLLALLVLMARRPSMLGV
jgi:putative membrane protein